MDHGLAPRLAILIDAENVAASYWPAACAIAPRFGTTVIARAYVCHAPPPGWIGLAGVEIIDGRPADGPNAADFLMAMDAAVLAAEGQVDAFMLMTADDGFAAVAHALKLRGKNVYALIPFNGSTVGRHLVAMVDVAILIPMTVPKPVDPDPPTPNWEQHFHVALAQCRADAEGWVDLGDLGNRLKATKVKLPKGKLSDVAHKVSEVEWQSGKSTFRLRRASNTPTQVAPAILVSAMPYGQVDEDDEIPF